jgi:hypothetical protein
MIQTNHDIPQWFTIPELQQLLPNKRKWYMDWVNMTWLI